MAENILFFAIEVNFLAKLPILLEIACDAMLKTEPLGERCFSGSRTSLGGQHQSQGPSPPLLLCISPIHKCREFLKYCPFFWFSSALILSGGNILDWGDKSSSLTIWVTEMDLNAGLNNGNLSLTYSIKIRIAYTLAQLPQRALNLKSCVLQIFLQEPLKHSG